MGTKNLAMLNVGVYKADKIGGKLPKWAGGGAAIYMLIMYLAISIHIPGLVPTGFTNLRISFEILLESTRFLKIVSIRFS